MRSCCCELTSTNDDSRFCAPVTSTRCTTRPLTRARVSGVNSAWRPLWVNSPYFGSSKDQFTGASSVGDAVNTIGRAWVRAANVATRGATSNSS
ncbi:hypothetical protein D3C87_1815770 [compost metagenome]